MLIKIENQQKKNKKEEINNYFFFCFADISINDLNNG